MAYYGDHALVPSRRTSGPEPDPSERKGNVIVDDDHVIKIQVKKVKNPFDGNTAKVHVSHRF